MVCLLMCLVGPACGVIGWLLPLLLWLFGCVMLRGGLDCLYDVR